MNAIVGAVLAILLLAQAHGERAYVVAGPDGDLELATRGGTLAIALGEGCGWIAPDLEVLVEQAARGVKLEAVDRSAECAAVEGDLVDASPCEMTQGQCDVTLAHIGAPPLGAIQNM